MQIYRFFVNFQIIHLALPTSIISIYHQTSYFSLFDIKSNGFSGCENLCI